LAASGPLGIGEIEVLENGMKNWREGVLKNEMKIKNPFTF